MDQEKTMRQIMLIILAHAVRDVRSGVRRPLNAASLQNGQREPCTPPLKGGQQNREARQCLALVSSILPRL